MSEIDLDALEAALATYKRLPTDRAGHAFAVDVGTQLPALIAELRDFRATAATAAAVQSLRDRP